MENKFGENLKKLLEQKSWSINALAKKIGAPAKTVTEWCGVNARVPRNPAHLKKLSEVLGCSVHFLLFGEEDPFSSVGQILNKTELHSGLYEITIKKVAAKGQK